MKLFEDWDWEDTWCLFGMLVLASLLVFVGTVALSSKQVDYYYLSRANSDNSSVGGSCVFAHWTWHPDEKAYCTEDKDKALDFVTRANQSLPKGK
jgi:hypothetical protein